MGVCVNKASEIGLRIEDWFKSKTFTSVKLTRNQNPKNDPNDAYVVKEDISIYSPSLERGTIEVSITLEGHVGIGIDKRERIASRLGLKSKSPRYAGGFEPQALPEAVIYKILDLVANGSISVSYMRLPLLGLVSTKLSLPEAEIRGLKSLGLNSADTVFAISRGVGSKNTVQLESWK